ncbi:hypothetical protein KC19_8G072800 [Ceratodon purpureus]|uniref:Protein kinase domain-containing protein n=1 Tax=Ceratodon purpureus TaxID=3225 RepID=A0A8T0GZV2_CERPU|nr:hypothetical protein KC19_8G072800 [Ceratodon purpureus]
MTDQGGTRKEDSNMAEGADTNNVDRLNENGSESGAASSSQTVGPARSQHFEEEVTPKGDELLNLVKGHLHDLKAGHTTGTQGSRAPDHTSSSDSLNGKIKGLSSYDLTTADRMLNDYIDDLRKSNLSPDLSVQMKIQEYEGLRDELRAAKQRDPDNFDNGRLLTQQQRNKLIEMLHDYQAVLEPEDDRAGLEQLDQNVTQPDGRISPTPSRHIDLEMELISNLDEGDVPLYLSDTHFSGGSYMESLAAALDLCDKQVQEFNNILRRVVIFIRLCTYLVETVSSITGTKFERYRNTLNQLQKMDVEKVRIPNNLRNSVSFCFESLVGLARRFQLVDDLLQKCASHNQWCKSALELADVRPRKHIMRWSEFSLAIRNCEWCLDLVELAFHALEKLLTHGTYTVKDASFKWSSEKGRMVLQIPGKFERQNSSRENVLLKKCRDLEDKDLVDLIAKLEELVKSEKERKRFLSTLFSSSNAQGIAYFLSEKLGGPTPEIGTYVPYSFSKLIDSTNLKYMEYLDKGSSGMVAIHDWFGMKVAVKSVRLIGLSRAQFEQEAAVLAMAQHPNVVRLIGCGFLEKSAAGPGTGQLVMELMDHDLRSIIDYRIMVLEKGSSPFSPMVAIDLMLQIAQGMLYLFENRILHRDLKAKNVLVNICKPLKTSGESDTANTKLMGLPVSAVLPHTQENYVAKLADFGLARCRPQSSYVTTAMAGTTGWRAPEIFHVPDSELANEYRWPADVYSFAMTGYEIVTGKMPFDDEPNYSLHGKIMEGLRPTFDNLRTDFPEAVKELIQECWATDPKDRPDFEYIVKRLWECKVLAILPGFERKIMDTPGASARFQ